MNSSRKYEYIMELSEIREFCRFAYLEQFKLRKGKWLGLLLIIVAEAFLVPEAAVIIAVMMAVTLTAAGINYYRSTVKQLEGQPWMVFSIDGNRLKVVRGTSAEVPFRNMQLIHKTKHLLMLGYFQSPKRPGWFVMPLRVFESEQEAEAFLAMVRNPQGQAGADFAGPMGQETDEAQPREYMRFSFFLDGERWVRLQKGAADLLNGGTLGRPARFYGMLVWGVVMAVALSVCTCLIAGEFQWMLVCYSLLIAVWFILRLYGRDPEKGIRKQLKSPEVAEKMCGPWQVSLTEEGVTVWMPMNMKNEFGWDTLLWLIETQEAFYLFYKDKKHFIMIAKESFVSWEQVGAFHRICEDHGVQKIPPKRARYVPEWLTWTILGLILLACAGVLAARIYLDVWHGLSGGQMTLEAEMTGLDGYPDGVPLEEQVEVLASLGLHVPEETVESIRSSMVEYDMYDLVEESPYTWLLMDMGGPSYDEDWNVTGYSSEVFWFDFEGFDISNDYIEVLNGMLALAQESPLDSVSDIREDMEDFDWEKGRGTITVSLNFKGQTYRYDMEGYDDWIDGRVLSIFNELLEQEASTKYFYATGDNGQGAIVFFCTEEWAAEFMQKTGLILERD